MSAPTGPPAALPEDTLLALAANVMVLMVTRYGDVTSADVVDKVLRSLDACGYDVVKRPAAEDRHDGPAGVNNVLTQNT